MAVPRKTTSNFTFLKPRRLSSCNLGVLSACMQQLLRPASVHRSKTKRVTMEIAIFKVPSGRCEFKGPAGVNECGLG